MSNTLDEWDIIQNKNDILIQKIDNINNNNIIIIDNISKIIKKIKLLNEKITNIENKLNCDKNNTIVNTDLQNIRYENTIWRNSFNFKNLEIPLCSTTTLLTTPNISTKYKSQYDGFYYDF